MIAVPAKYIPGSISYPTFSFIPDSSDSWVNNVDISRNVSTSHYYQISAGEAGETKTWTASGDDKNYSFNIEAHFANKPQTIDVTISNQMEGHYADRADSLPQKKEFVI